ncbi:MAG: phosphoglucosamine mutase [Candidatus Hydrogenedentales bacterium]|jgi:phosphoglucosamine mutase
MSERLFGTDGIRGIANRYPMSAELALQVGRAVGHIFQREERQHTILIGKDTRRSGYMLENALTAGLCSMGVHVLLVGPLPTPGVSYILRSLRCDAGIMISASHNAFQYNGIKLFGPDGYKLPDSVEDDITRLIQNGEVEDIRPVAERIGTARRIDDAVGRYIEFAKSCFPKGMRLDGLKIVCDCAHGASYKVGPSTFSELGAEVIALGNRPSGTNINDCCGSTHPEDMRATVIRERANVGIAFDGDADRIVMADEDGRLIDGNGLLAILACDMLETKRLPKNCLATTIMANGGLLKAIEPLGGQVVWTKVGDRYVVEAMREHELALGGESSGHVVMLEYNTTGDALIAALQVLATMVRREAPLSVLASAYQQMPEAHAHVPHDNGAKPSEEKLAEIVREAEAKLKGRGRVVIRASGTEPIIRVMVQHELRRDAESLAQELAKQVASL